MKSSIMLNHASQSALWQYVNILFRENIMGGGTRPPTMARHAGITRGYDMSFFRCTDNHIACCTFWLIVVTGDCALHPNICFYSQLWRCTLMLLQPSTMYEHNYAGRMFGFSREKDRVSKQVQSSNNKLPKIAEAERGWFGCLRSKVVLEIVIPMRTISPCAPSID